ncbi:hypothetical protein [Sedimentitalea todarodis]|uniref:Sulfotransferase family protein n=1 Tax=Sedimentitalea todarodis TaxID=1631240 RepID=A0ABU3VK51_9RHOB|nr:hypothetical protein [Sedimentitalea todarodis]MDU9006557.1 hypothetical protein [Sedimentitalea todarodis]
MKVITFFGHHKVGSTALQAFFARNHLALLRRGILYPAVEVEGLAQSLAGALNPDRPPALDRMNVREPHNALAFRMLAQATGGKPPDWHGNLPAVAQMIRALRLQADYLQPHTVILCSEVMSNFGSNHPRLIDTLRGIFPDATHELYCVLRRPDEYLTSWHAQRLRFGDKVSALSDKAARSYFAGIHFDYKRLLVPWIKRFADSTLHLRNYADVLAAGGSTEDFLARCGIGLGPDLIPAGRANTSLPRAAMELARRANLDLPAEQARILRQYLLEHGDRLNPVKNADVEMFGPDLRADMARRFAPVHDYLSALTGQPFFPDIDQLSTPRPIPEARATAQLLDRIDPTDLPDPALRDYISALHREIAA